VDAVTTGRTDGKPPADREIFEKQLRTVLKYLNYAPVIFLSALEATGPGGSKLQRVLHEVVAVAAERRKRVSTGQMNRFLEKVDSSARQYRWPESADLLYDAGRRAPPTFVLSQIGNQAALFFERFLENQIREAFGFKGTPIWFKVKARNEKKAE